MSKAEVRRPVVTASVAGVDSAELSNAALSVAVGQWPTAVIEFHSAGKGNEVVRVLSSDVIKQLGALQQLGFAGRTTADSGITIEDGAGGTLEFGGLVVSPRYSLQYGMLGKGVNVIHQAALMDGIKTGIYNWEGYTWAEKSTKISSDSWAGIIRDVTRFLVENGRTKWYQLGSADSALAQRYHQDNTRLLDGMFYPMLENSIETTKSEGLAQLSSQDGIVLANAIGMAIMSYLMASREGFWQTINQLCAAFQLVYVPPVMADEFGQLVNLVDAVAGEPEDATIDAVACEFQHASASALPLRQVLLRTSGQSLWAHGGRDTSRALLVWPETATTDGQVHDTTAPTWITSASSLDRNRSQPIITTTDKPGIRTNVSLQSAISLSDLNQRVEKAIDEKVNTLMRDYAKAIYADRSLAGATMNLRIPLDVKWQPGKRYSVSSDEGRMFTGFLAQVRHTAGIGGAEANASTTLSFTHVMLGDFSLPGA